MKFPIRAFLQDLVLNREVRSPVGCLFKNIKACSFSGLPFLSGVITDNIYEIDVIISANLAKKTFGFDFDYENVPEFGEILLNRRHCLICKLSDLKCFCSTSSIQGSVQSSLDINSTFFDESIHLPNFQHVIQTSEVNNLLTTRMNSIKTPPIRKKQELPDNFLDSKYSEKSIFDSKSQEICNIHPDPRNISEKSGVERLLEQSYQISHKNTVQHSDMVPGEEIGKYQNIGIKQSNNLTKKAQNKCIVRNDNIMMSYKRFQTKFYKVYDNCKTEEIVGMNFFQKDHIFVNLENYRQKCLRNILIAVEKVNTNILKNKERRKENYFYRILRPLKFSSNFNDPSVYNNVDNHPKTTEFETNSTQATGNTGLSVQYHLDCESFCFLTENNNMNNKNFFQNIERNGVFESVNSLFTKGYSCLSEKYFLENPCTLSPSNSSSLGKNSWKNIVFDPCLIVLLDKFKVKFQNNFFLMIDDFLYLEDFSCVRNYPHISADKEIQRMITRLGISNEVLVSKKSQICELFNLPEKLEKITFSKPCNETICKKIYVGRHSKKLKLSASSEDDGHENISLGYDSKSLQVSTSSNYLDPKKMFKDLDSDFDYFNESQERNICFSNSMVNLERSPQIKVEVLKNKDLPEYGVWADEEDFCLHKSYEQIYKPKSVQNKAISAHFEFESDSENKNKPIHTHIISQILKSSNFLKNSMNKQFGLLDLKSHNNINRIFFNSTNTDQRHDKDLYHNPKEQSSRLCEQNNLNERLNMEYITSNKKDRKLHSVNNIFDDLVSISTLDDLKPTFVTSSTEQNILSTQKSQIVRKRHSLFSNEASKPYQYVSSDSSVLIKNSQRPNILTLSASHGKNKIFKPCFQSKHRNLNNSIIQAKDGSDKRINSSKLKLIPKLRRVDIKYLYSFTKLKNCTYTIQFVIKNLINAFLYRAGSLLYLQKYESTSNYEKHTAIHPLLIHSSDKISRLFFLRDSTYTEYSNKKSGYNADISFNSTGFIQNLSEINAGEVYEYIPKSSKRSKSQYFPDNSIPSAKLSPMDCVLSSSNDIQGSAISEKNYTEMKTSGLIIKTDSHEEISFKPNVIQPAHLHYFKRGQNSCVKRHKRRKLAKINSSCAENLETITKTSSKDNHREPENRNSKEYLIKNRIISYLSENIHFVDNDDGKRVYLRHEGQVIDLSKVLQNPETNLQLTPEYEFKILRKETKSKNRRNKQVCHTSYYMLGYQSYFSPLERQFFENTGLKKHIEHCDFKVKTRYQEPSSCKNIRNERSYVCMQSIRPNNFLHVYRKFGCLDLQKMQLFCLRELNPLSCPIFAYLTANRDYIDTQIRCKFFHGNTDKRSPKIHKLPTTNLNRTYHHKKHHLDGTLNQSCHDIDQIRNIANEHLFLGLCRLIIQSHALDNLFPEIRYTCSYPNFIHLLTEYSTLQTLKIKHQNLSKIYRHLWRRIFIWQTKELSAGSYYIILNPNLPKTFKSPLLARKEPIFTDALLECLLHAFKTSRFYKNMKFQNFGLVSRMHKPLEKSNLNHFLRPQNSRHAMENPKTLLKRPSNILLIHINEMRGLENPNYHCFEYPKYIRVGWIANFLWFLKFLGYYFEIGKISRKKSFSEAIYEIENILPRYLCSPSINQDYQEYISSKIKRKYPNISSEYISKRAKITELFFNTPMNSFDPFLAPIIESKNKISHQNNPKCVTKTVGFTFKEFLPRSYKFDCNTQLSKGKLRRSLLYSYLMYDLRNKNLSLKAQPQHKQKYARRSLGNGPFFRKYNQVGETFLAKYSDMSSINPADHKKIQNYRNYEYFLNYEPSRTDLVDSDSLPSFNDSWSSVNDKNEKNFSLEDVDKLNRIHKFNSFFLSTAKFRSTNSLNRTPFSSCLDKLNIIDSKPSLTNLVLYNDVKMIQYYSNQTSLSKKSTLLYKFYINQNEEGSSVIKNSSHFDIFAHINATVSSASRQGDFYVIKSKFSQPRQFHKGTCQINEVLSYRMLIFFQNIFYTFNELLYRHFPCKWRKFVKNYVNMNENVRSSFRYEDSLCTCFETLLFLMHKLTCRKCFQSLNFSLKNQIDYINSRSAVKFKCSSLPGVLYSLKDEIISNSALVIFEAGNFHDKIHFELMKYVLSFILGSHIDSPQINQFNSHIDTPTVGYISSFSNILVDLTLLSRISDSYAVVKDIFDFLCYINMDPSVFMRWIFNLSLKNSFNIINQQTYNHKVSGEKLFKKHNRSIILSVWRLFKKIEKSIEDKKLVSDSVYAQKSSESPKCLSANLSVHKNLENANCDDFQDLVTDSKESNRDYSQAVPKNLVICGFQDSSLHLEESNRDISEIVNSNNFCAIGHSSLFRAEWKNAGMSYQLSRRNRVHKVKKIRTSTFTKKDSRVFSKSVFRRAKSLYKTEIHPKGPTKAACIPAATTNKGNSLSNISCSNFNSVLTPSYIHTKNNYQDHEELQATVADSPSLISELLSHTAENTCKKHHVASNQIYDYHVETQNRNIRKNLQDTSLTSTLKTIITTIAENPHNSQEKGDVIKIKALFIFLTGLICEHSQLCRFWGLKYLKNIHEQIHVSSQPEILLYDSHYRLQINNRSCNILFDYFCNSFKDFDIYIMDTLSNPSHYFADEKVKDTNEFKNSLQEISKFSLPGYRDFSRSNYESFSQNRDAHVMSNPNTVSNTLNFKKTLPSTFIESCLEIQKTQLLNAIPTSELFRIKKSSEIVISCLNKLIKMLNGSNQNQTNYDLINSELTSWNLSLDSPSNGKFSKKELLKNLTRVLLPLIEDSLSSETTSELFSWRKSVLFNPQLIIMIDNLKIGIKSILSFINAYFYINDINLEFRRRLIAASGKIKSVIVQGDKRTFITYNTLKNLLYKQFKSPYTLSDIPINPRSFFSSYFPAYGFSACSMIPSNLKSLFDAYLIFSQMFSIYGDNNHFSYIISYLLIEVNCIEKIMLNDQACLNFGPIFQAILKNAHISFNETGRRFKNSMIERNSSLDFMIPIFKNFGDFCQSGHEYTNFTDLPFFLKNYGLKSLEFPSMPKTNFLRKTFYHSNSAHLPVYLYFPIISVLSNPDNLLTVNYFDLRNVIIASKEEISTLLNQGLEKFLDIQFLNIYKDRKNHIGHKIWFFCYTSQEITQFVYSNRSKTSKFVYLDNQDRCSLSYRVSGNLIINTRKAHFFELFKVLKVLSLDFEYFNIQQFSMNIFNQTGSILKKFQIAHFLNNILNIILKLRNSSTESEKFFKTLENVRLVESEKLMVNQISFNKILFQLYKTIRDPKLSWEISTFFSNSLEILISDQISSGELSRFHSNQQHKFFQNYLTECETQLIIQVLRMLTVKSDPDLISRKNLENLFSLQKHLNSIEHPPKPIDFSETNASSNRYLNEPNFAFFDDTENIQLNPTPTPCLKSLINEDIIIINEKKTKDYMYFKKGSGLIRDISNESFFENSLGCNETVLNDSKHDKNFTIKSIEVIENLKRNLIKKSRYRLESSKNARLGRKQTFKAKNVSKTPRKRAAARIITNKNSEEVSSFQLMEVEDIDSDNEKFENNFVFIREIPYKRFNNNRTQKIAFRSRYIEPYLKQLKTIYFFPKNHFKSATTPKTLCTLNDLSKSNIRSNIINSPYIESAADIPKSYFCSKASKIPCLSGSRFRMFLNSPHFSQLSSNTHLSSLFENDVAQHNFGANVRPACNNISEINRNPKNNLVSNGGICYNTHESLMNISNSRTPFKKSYRSSKEPFNPLKGHQKNHKFQITNQYPVSDQSSNLHTSLDFKSAGESNSYLFMNHFDHHSEAILEKIIYDNSKVSIINPETNQTKNEIYNGRFTYKPRKSIVEHLDSSQTSQQTSNNSKFSSSHSDLIFYRSKKKQQ